MNSGNSLTELIIVGLISGGLAALLPIIWRVGYEREELIRTRLIPVAEDFATVAIQAMNATRGFIRDPTGEGSQQMQRCTDEAIARLARVELLFGPVSKTGRAAAAVSASLHLARVEAAGRAPDPDRVRGLADAARTDLDRFICLVYNRVGTPRWQQWLKYKRALFWLSLALAVFMAVVSALIITGPNLTGTFTRDETWAYVTLALTAVFLCFSVYLRKRAH